MEFYDGTIRSQVQDFLHSKNALVFSYGVTNAGKTHTIQGMKYSSATLHQNNNARCLRVLKILICLELFSKCSSGLSVNLVWY